MSLQAMGRHKWDLSLLAKLKNDPSLSQLVFCAKKSTSDTRDATRNSTDGDNVDSSSEEDNSDDRDQLRRRKFGRADFDLHREDITVLHIACQENLVETCKYIV
jgi:hypothetical protein